ncbi:class I poly(R)-hydroxyalkanoic acid synthase [Magnetospira thiophila]
MSDNQASQPTTPDPGEVTKIMSDIAERSQRLVSDFLARQATDGSPGNLDPLNIGQAFMEMTTKMMADPAKLMQAQMNLWQDYMALWQSTTRRMLGQDVEPVATPARDDRRFRDESWSDNEVFDYIKQSYLLTSRWMQAVVGDVEGLDDKTKHKVEFYTKLFTDALSPTNFAATNPEVLRATADSGGENLLKGLQHMLEDLERGKGQLRISMTDYDAFKVGENVANTPGKVVFQNDMMQLLQYTPTTEEVQKSPLLIVPPWINKFYIMDLRAKNSMIKWFVDQGLTVFVISWINPDERHKDKDFTNYMLEGPITALDAIKEATGEEQVNAIGYCIGGTLMAGTLAYMEAKNDKRIKSCTYFTTMIDFAEPGDLGVFIDEKLLAGIDEAMAEKGYLDGAEMAQTFNLLRSNDLIWSFVINNYLMGKDPFPFDLLYWNSDSTRLPQTMHSYYLRNMYLENKFIQPGALEFGGVPIDLRTITVPSYVLSAQEDHISPWKSNYVATQTYAGPVKFVLAGSGHIAGVINPPAANKYFHFTKPGKAPKDPDKWLEGAKRNEGSWWPDWLKWVTKYGAGTVPARIPGDGKLSVLEDAPGSYVKARLD